MTDLPTSMRAILQDTESGALRLAQVPLPRPEADEVLIRVAASPINPSDLMMLQGAYGVSFDYPMTPGLEGSGQVVATGGAMMSRFMAGRRVASAATKQGHWAEYAVVPAGLCLPLPGDISFATGAMAIVNPLTAFAFGQIARRRRIRALVSTAAAGQLGAMIRRTCKSRGIEVINVVRSEAQRAAVAAEGAIALDMTADGFDEALAEECRRIDCRFALDAVGGDVTYRLVEALPSRSEVLIYGGLSQQASRLHPGTMIFKETTVRGFWLSKWLMAKSLPERFWISRQVMAGLKGGFATSDVARVVELDDAPDAPAGYAADMSGGKWLIAPQGAAHLES